MTYRCVHSDRPEDNRRETALTAALEVILELLAQSQVDADDSMDRLTTDLERLLDDPVFMDVGAVAGVEQDHRLVRARIISEVQFYDLMVQRIQRIHGCLKVVQECLSGNKPMSPELENRLSETVRFFHESPPPSRTSKADDIVIFFDDMAD